MKPITLIIPGSPIAWQRPGLTRDRIFYNRQQKEVTMFGLHVAQQYTDDPITDIPLLVECFFYMPIANRFWSKYDGKPCTTAPDCDNLVKFVFDALQGIVYKNDKLVTKHTATKVWSKEPRTIITISEHVTKKGESCVPEK